MTQTEKLTFTIVLGGLGTNKSGFAEFLSGEEPKSILISFKNLLLKQLDNQQMHQTIQTFPLNNVSESYYQTKNIATKVLYDNVDQKKSLIVCSSGNNKQSNMFLIDNLKRLGYKIIVYFLRESVQEQIISIDKQNANEQNVLDVTRGTVMDNYSRLLENVYSFKEKADVFNYIEV